MLQDWVVSTFIITQHVTPLRAIAPQFECNNACTKLNILDEDEVSNIG